MTSSEEEGFIASHRFPMFVARDRACDLDFMRRMFLTKRGKTLLELASPGGAGRNKTLGQQEFLKLQPVVPTPEEQRKIAAFLGAVDAKLDALGREREGLRRFKAGLMDALFTRALRFTRADGSEFPDWEEKRLGDIATFQKGRGIAKDDVVAGGATPCVRYGEVYTTYGERIDEVVSRTNVRRDQLLLSEPGDVIIPASGETPEEMARACCVLRAGVALGGDLNVLRSPVNGEFLAYYLTHARRAEIARAAQGISVVHLYASHLKPISVEVPHSDEQARIAAALDAMDRRIDLASREIDLLGRFKAGLLQQMFV